MGCECSDSSDGLNKNMDSDPNTYYDGGRRKRNTTDELDSYSYTVDVEGTSAAAIHSTREKQGARREFKKAVLEGNESVIMHYISEFGDVDLLGLMFQDGQTALHLAVRQSHYGMMSILLETGADVK